MTLSVNGAETVCLMCIMLANATCRFSAAALPDADRLTAAAPAGSAPLLSLTLPLPAVSAPLLSLTRTQLELLELGLAAEALAAADLVPAASAASQKRRRATNEAELETDLLETEGAVSDQQVHDRLGRYLADVKGEKLGQAGNNGWSVYQYMSLLLIDLPFALKISFSL